MEDFESAQCPRDRDCGEGLSSFSVGTIPCYVGIVSTSLSCVAAVAMVAIYLAWKDIRQKGAQSIVTFIAIADFFTAAAYLAGSVSILIHYNETDIHQCEAFQVFCEIESYIMTSATMSSYFWTIILALYFYLAIVRGSRKLARRLMPVYHVIAWGVPILIAFPLLCTGKLTYAPFVGGTWCYMDIVDTFDRVPPFSQKDFAIAVVIKMPEILAYLLILFLYFGTKIHLYRQTQRITASTIETSDYSTSVGVQTSLSHTHRVQGFLLFIPVLFVILRVWCTVQFFFAISISKYAQDGCIPFNLKVTYVILGILQAIGAGGQGWANAILYIFLSPTIRNRLIALCKRRTPSSQEAPVVPSTTYFSPPISSNYNTLISDSLI